MQELDRDDARTLLLGTWTAIALIVEVLIQQAVIPRYELLETLQEAQALAQDDRRTAIVAVRMLIERFGRTKWA